MKKTTFIAALLCLILGCTAVLPNAYAEEAAMVAPGSVLELTPVNKRMALDPGETRESHITVKNLSSNELRFSVYATPFSNGDGGETQDFDTETRYTQISRWITIKNDNGEYGEKANSTLASKQSKDIYYKIVVPENVAGGGQYASIIVELAPAAGNFDDIQTTSRAGMVLFADISGETERAAEITGIQAQVAAIGNNIGIKFTVKNNGNIDLQSSAEIVVSSVFGKELYRNSTLSAVFPENSKTVIAEWGETPPFGIYRLDYTIAALDINATGGQYVLVMEPIILGTFVVLIVAAIIAIVYLLKKHTIDKDKEIIIG